MYPELLSHSQIQATDESTSISFGLSSCSLEASCRPAVIVSCKCTRAYISSSLVHFLFCLHGNPKVCWVGVSFSIQLVSSPMSNPGLFPASQSTKDPSGHQDLVSVLYPDFFPRAMERIALNLSFCSSLSQRYTPKHPSCFPVNSSLLSSSISVVFVISSPICCLLCPPFGQTSHLLTGDWFYSSGPASEVKQPLGDIL